MFSLRVPGVLRRTPGHLTSARRSGTGVYVEEWRFEGSPAAAEPVLNWCRETLAGTRRPWGIGHFDLALAVGTATEAGVRSLSLHRLSPIDLYPGQTLLDELSRFLEAEGDALEHLAVALFSWGDAAHAGLPQA